jgi:FlaA1/EpsC-like NDP-sugar epimerase
MITASDSHNTIDIGKYFAILPANGKQKYLDYYKGSKEVPKGYSYNSGTNDQWVDVEEMRNQIRKHVDPDFKPVS